jgi:uncharacterized protein YfiM (DUF2279 family)
VGVLALLASLPALAQQRAAGPEDPWVGRDKALHFGVSTLGPLAGYAAGEALFGDGARGLWVGGAVGLGVGVGKELYDLSTGRGTPSVRDLAWDAAGTAAGLAFGLAVDRLFFAEERQQRLLRQERRAEERRRRERFDAALTQQLALARRVAEAHARRPPAAGPGPRLPRPLAPSPALPLAP